jgi:hypothetical protein
VPTRCATGTFKINMHMVPEIDRLAATHNSIELNKMSASTAIFFLRLQCEG